MAAILKRQLFQATVFDSGALGLTTSVVHQFVKPGVYRASVQRNGKPARDIVFEVRDGVPDMQLDIDLAAAETRSRGRDGCNCGSSGSESLVVSPRGYVLFHATASSGWSVRVGQGDQEVFDSERLGEGDIFAMTLLEPTQYRLENKLGNAKGTIVVTFSPSDAKKLGALQPVTVTVSKAFEPAELKLISTQGLVFRMKTEARIVVTRQGDQPLEQKPGSLRIRRPHLSTAERSGA